MDPQTSSVPQILQAWREGDSTALERLLPLVHEELWDVARPALAGEKGGPPGVTEAVRETYGRLVSGELPWQDRGHFFAIAARTMRQLLVDHARSDRAMSAGGDWIGQTLDGGLAIASPAPRELLDLDRALTAFAAQDRRAAQTAELHWFGGLAPDDLAKAMNATQIATYRDLRLAKAWIRGAAAGAVPASPVLEPGRWARVRSVFDAAAAVDPGLRASLLDQECTGDPELRSEVERLLTHVAAAAPVTVARASAATAATSPRAGIRNGFASAGQALRGLGAKGRAWPRHARTSAPFVLAMVAAGAIALGMRSEQARRRAEHESAFLGDMLGTLDPRTTAGRDVSLVREMLDASSGRVEAALPGDPAAAATVRLALGRAYAAVGATAEAEQALRAALEGRIARGASPEALAEARHALGALYADQGRNEEAEPLLSAALATRKDASRREPAAYLQTLGRMAALRAAEGREAEPLHREAVEFARQRFGTASAEYAGQLARLGSWRAAQPPPSGGTKAPVAELDDAVAAWRSVEPRDPLAFADALEAAAAMHAGLGDHATAEPLLREAISLREGALEEGHPLVAGSYEQLARMAGAQGHVDEAERLYRETLRIRSAHGGDSPELAATHHELGVLLRDAGRPRDAAVELAATARILSANPAADDTRAAWALLELARTWDMAGDCDAAAPVLDEFDRVAARHWEAHAYPRYLADGIRGRCLLATRRNAEAEQVLLGAYEGAVAYRGDDHEETRAAAAALVSLYESWGKPGWAAPYRPAASPPSAAP